MKAACLIQEIKIVLKGFVVKMHQEPVLLREFHIKIHVTLQGFSNILFDCLAEALDACNLSQYEPIITGWAYCVYVPECIVTTKYNTPVLITMRL